MRYAVGLDTGGTFTDAALMNLDTGEVLAGAKHPTTHRDLSKGIFAALRQVLDGVDPSLVRQVSVSTTLATNAVVEGHGARVGLIVIGHTRPFNLPVEFAEYVSGGHAHTGKEVEPLGIEALAEAVQKFKGKVDAIAVCGAMSIKNPAHELVAAKAISLMAPEMTVFCSHLVSELAGMEERSATAVLNARLMPVMRNFLDQVRESLAELGVDCAVSVVRGDGTLMDVSEAVQAAAHTFASGPAATAFFGAHASQDELGGGEVLVMDVGGTTTDVTLVGADGPIIGRGGSQIGDWPTHVSSVSMHTAGVGGDSHVRPAGRGLDGVLVGPGRVQSLAVASSLPGFVDPALWLGIGGATRLAILNPEDAKGSHGPCARALGQKILDHLREHGPVTVAQLMTHLRVPLALLDAELERLFVEQRIILVGYTPTDALNVTGVLELGDVAASRAGAQGLARLEGMGADADEVSRRTLDATVDRIESAVLHHVLRREAGHDMGGLLGARARFKFLDVQFSLRMPIIGLGAAGRHLLPLVAERLNADILFPDHFEIGNAVGALYMSRG